MTWHEIQEQYPSLWLIVEALDAKTVDGERIWGSFNVIKPFQDSKRALSTYAQMRRKQPRREFHVFHADNPAPSVDDMFDLWLKR